MRIRNINCSLLAPFLFVGVAIAIYWPTLHNFFVAEDLIYSWNVDLQFALNQFFPRAVVGYRPVMFVTWWLANSIWTYQPFPLRWLVVLLHATNGLLVFAIGRTISKRLIGGFITGSIFLLLPTHTDALNWLSAAFNQLTCAFFYLFTLWFYLQLTHLNRGRKGIGSGSGMRVRLTACVMITMVLAMSSNEVALTLPLALCGIELAEAASPWIMERRIMLRDLQPAFRRIYPIIIVWLGFIVFRSIAVEGIGGYGESVHLRAGSLLFRTTASNLKLLVDPVNLSGFIPSGIDWIFANPLLVLFFFIFLIVVLWPGRIGLCVFMTALLPVLNIPAGHRLYVPSIGYAIALGITIQCVLFRPKPRAMTATLMALLLTISLLGETASTIKRNGVWIQASSITRFVTMETRNLFPAVLPNTVFYFYGLPKTLDRAQVFNFGLAQAIQATYRDRSLNAFQVRAQPDPRFDVDRSAEAITRNAALEMSQLFLIYDPDTITLNVTTRERFIQYVTAHPAS